MHELPVFGEKPTTIYVLLEHDQNSPCVNINKPYHCPVERVHNIDEAEKTASRYHFFCKKCGAKYNVPKKKV